MRKQFCVALSRYWLGILLVVGLLGWSMPASTQTRPNNQLLIELLNRIEHLEQEIRQLRGDLEVYRYRQQELQQQVQALRAAPDSTTDIPESLAEPSFYDFNSSEGGPMPESTTPPPAVRTPSPYAEPLPAPSPATAPPLAASGSEQSAYQVALDRLREGRYEQAIVGFQEFVRAYPNSSLADDAQYWLGEAYYVNRDFGKARDAFVTLGINYPNNRRLPDALLKLSYIYDELGDKAKAREVLQKLLEVYPESQAAKQGQDRLRAIR